jgi:hypothetical protein
MRDFIFKLFLLVGVLDGDGLGLLHLRLLLPDLGFNLASFGFKLFGSLDDALKVTRLKPKSGSKSRR